MWLTWLNVILRHVMSIPKDLKGSFAFDEFVDFVKLLCWRFYAGHVSVEVFPFVFGI